MAVVEVVLPQPPTGQPGSGDSEPGRVTSVINGSLHHAAASDDQITEENWVYPWPTDFRIREQPIDEGRELKVAVIGAGLAGITAATLLPVKVPGVTVTVFDKNADVGGTWLENIYPGVRCDIPAHAYQSTFAPKTDWTEEYAQGPEILGYWQSVARKHDVYSKCRFETIVRGAFWNEASAKWRVESENLKSKELSTDDFDFLISATGRFNDWQFPSIEGLDSFKGHLAHSSHWDPEFDPKGKRIATIGNGASGIQVTTELQKVASHIDHYARNKTWIAGSFGEGVAERQDKPMLFSKEQIASFEDPAIYLEYRKGLESILFKRFESQLRDSEATKNATAKFRDIMKQRLGGDDEMVKKLVPDFPPFCRRVTPGPGYLEALTKDNLEFIQTPIQRITEGGVVTVDGKERKVDAIICSTGANVGLAPSFPIVAGEYDLSRDWKPEGKFGFPYNYLGTATPGFPNFATLLGPQPPGTTGTVPHGAEVQVTYVAKILRKISSQGVRSIAPSVAATDDFLEFCDAFFPRTNMSRKCSSWYNGGKPGARIHGCWPGSAAHWTQTLREPRWEDFEYTYLRDNAADGTGLVKENRFAYLGNGWTRKELQPGSDLTPHLKLPSENDLRDLHERWWDV